MPGLNHEARAGVDLDVEHLLRLRHLAGRMRAPRGMPRSSLPGGIVHRRRGRGLEIHDVRPWFDGDDPRHLDRNVTARTGQPHVRNFRDERERNVMLLADFRPSMLFGTHRALRSVAAGEALAMLGWRVAGEGGRVGLLAAAPAGNHLARYGRGVRGMVTLVGTLAAAHADALASTVGVDTPLAELLAEADRLAGSGGTILVATALDTPGERFDAIATAIARRRDLRFILVSDRFERAPAPGSYPYVTAEGASGWFRIARNWRKPAVDEAARRLDWLGASSLRIEASLNPEAMARALERLDA